MDQEDYLHAIYLLTRSGREARMSDIARTLKVQKPSVSQMAERLKRQGYIMYKPYQDITLTPKGRKIALSIHERHEALADFFTTIGIPKKVQEHDIHGLEHYLSPITLKKLRAITKFLKEFRA
jgi:DtxR family transcriptional regulator, Mn-dependent transcriptional regulator